VPRLSSALSQDRRPIGRSAAPASPAARIRNSARARKSNLRKAQTDIPLRQTKCGELLSHGGTDSVLVLERPAWARHTKRP